MWGTSNEGPKPTKCHYGDFARRVRGGFQEALGLKHLLLGCLWQQEGNPNGSLFESEEYKTVSCFGTKKKTLQNLTKILNLFYLTMCLEESNIMQNTHFSWLQKCIASYSWAVPNQTLSKAGKRENVPWYDWLLVACLFHCIGWMNWINYFHFITIYTVHVLTCAIGTTGLSVRHTSWLK